jgi:hypothetical protein
MLYPVHRQVKAIMTVILAQNGSINQGTGWLIRRIARRVLLMNPSKLNIILNSTAYVTKEVTAGRKIPVLKTPLNLIDLSFNNEAMTKEDQSIF